MKRWLLALPLLALSVSTAAGQATRLSVPISVDTLGNGLTLIVHEDHSIPNVAVNIWYLVGSADEKPGRTGFAHLFEHLMFMGSQNAEYPMFDRLLEAAGGNNNASTANDRTNYYEEGPANALPLMLWLEADRMGWFLPTMTSEKVDLQRDVVKNERRQSYENQPYGLAWETLSHALYPATHPYYWPVIGSMTDLSAASLDDTKNFFRQYYEPNNAVLTIAGDVNPAEVKAMVRQYFGEIPRGAAIARPTVPSFTLARDTVMLLEDRVQLPRVYNNWHTARLFSADDAALNLLAYLLTGAKNSRLTQALVYDQQIATNVVAFNDGKRLDGDFIIFATAKPGHSLPELQRSIDAELHRLMSEGPTPRELQQAQNSIESAFLDGLEQIDSKADQLNTYYFYVGQPDYFQQDLARYRAVTTQEIQRLARQYLGAHRVVLSVVPQGKTEMAVTAAEATP
ncbi:MAG: pitrilysin family protein [Gemmatimonadota bacterium]